MNSYYIINVKINVVVMKGFNDDEINDFIAWTTHIPVQVRFIEFMPFSGNRWTSNKVFSLHEILANISKQYSFLPLQAECNDTAKSFMVPGQAGSFAVISTMSETVLQHLQSHAVNGRWQAKELSFFNR